MSTVYIDPLIQKVFDLLEANMGIDEISGKPVITTFYQGDPIFINKSNLPCICVAKDGTDITDESNAEDAHGVNMVLTLVIDIRDYVEDDMADVHVADQRLYDLMEGRNADYTLKTNSIIAILRRNEELGNNAHIDTTKPMTADYGFTVGKRGEKSWACEANLTVPIFFSQLR